MRLTPVNKESELQGSEFYYRGTKFKIARASNTAYKKTFREKIKPYQNAHDSDTMSDDIAESIMTECFAKTILVGWDNIVDCDTGKDYKYSIQNAILLLDDDKDFYKAAITFSENIENFIILSDDKIAEKSQS